MKLSSDLRKGGYELLGSKSNKGSIGKALDFVENVLDALAAALGTTVDYLLSSADVYTLTAQEKGGASAARDIEELVSEVTGLFAGGQLSEDALEGAMRALNDAYWQAKEKNKKYTPKKYRHADQ